MNGEPARHRVVRHGILDKSGLGDKARLVEVDGVVPLLAALSQVQQLDTLDLNLLETCRNTVCAPNE